MLNLINSQYRSDPNFHRSQVTQVLPEFFQTEYPRLVTFLKKYYEYTGEDGSVSYDEQIHSLFGIRNISNAELSTLDLLIGEISEGLESSSFYQNPRLMTRLLSNFYRNKGTQLSVEQFFKAFFNEDVDVSYPKEDIFILNDKPGGSLIGPQALKYIQDDKKYQIFSILLKTGIAVSEYEDFYKKMVHPAGWHLSSEVEVQEVASMGFFAGMGTEPLETPNYAVVVQGSMVRSSFSPLYSLLTMEETDSVDARDSDQRANAEGIVISSLETLERYKDITLQQIEDLFSTAIIDSDGNHTLDSDGNPAFIKGTIGDWAGVTPRTLDNGTLSLSSEYQTLDDDDYL